MKKILITGGAGFIGSEFVRQGALNDEHMVVIDTLSYAGDIVRLKEAESSISFYKANVNDRNAIEEIFNKENPDCVVHFAAESHVDRSIDDASPFIDSNVKGTQVLLDAARHWNIKKFINISTDEVYGDLGEDGCFIETTPLNPSSPYSVSKAAADMLGRAYFRTYGLPVITIRPSNNYGPWQYPEKLIPVIILNAIDNKRIPVYGTGQNVREWLYVSDCAEAIWQVLEKGRGGDVYNIGSSEEMRNIEVVRTILGILGKSEGLIEFVKDRPGHDFRYCLNSGKLRNEIGFVKKTSVGEGMEKTVKWYLDNIDWVKSKL